MRHDMDNVIDTLTKQLIAYDPEKIWLIGSRARGQQDQYSDIDVIIIKETEQPFLVRLKTICGYYDVPISVDTFIYTPQEFTKMIQQKNVFLEHALKGAKVLYERPQE